MKVIISVCLLLAISWVDLVFCNDALLDPVSKHGQLAVNGVDLVDQSGQKVQLKGMSLSWSIWYPQYYNQATVDGVKNYCHSNIIRAALAVDTNDGGYLTDPETHTALIETVIEAAIKDDIYVLIDWHDHEAQDHLQQSITFFDRISKKYSNYSNIIYETYNEPIIEDWATVKSYHEAVVKTIRANDPDNVIVLGTPFYSQKLDLAAADPLQNQKNIMYSLHFYAGTHKQWLRDVTADALNAGLPVFVSEYGSVNADATAPVDVEESMLWYEFLDARGISYVNYNIADKDEGASALVPGTPAEKVCQDEYLTESGRLAVDHNKV